MLQLYFSTQHKNITVIKPQNLVYMDSCKQDFMVKGKGRNIEFANY